MPYLPSFKRLGFKTLGDLDRLIRNFSDDAYELAVYQIGNTDLDIISSTVSIQDLLIVYILENGGGQLGLEMLFNEVNGASEYNRSRAERIVCTSANLKFMHKGK